MRSVQLQFQFIALLFCLLVTVSGSVAQEATEATSSDERSADSTDAASASRAKLIVVVGASGEEEFSADFQQSSQEWAEMAKRESLDLLTIGPMPAGDTTVKEELLSTISEHEGQPLWLVMLGHGTYGGNVAKFNLVGPDITAAEFKKLLANRRSELVIINCSSCSAPFLPDLAGEQRIIITATKSGAEFNYSRFGKFLAASINDPTIDIDHDQEVSLLEAFLAASSRTERFYQQDARLATEHALLDDNGDRAGITADFYRGIRPVKSGADGASIDGADAARIIVMSSEDAIQLSQDQQRERNFLEEQLKLLRGRRSLYSEPEYLNELERILIKIASIYDDAEMANPPSDEAVKTN